MRRPTRAFIQILAGCGAALALGAQASCGPIESTSLQWQVEARLLRAEKLDAERTAPYEYTAAQRFLHKGKEEAGYADFEAAIDYLHKARLMAKQAEERAEAAQRFGGPSRSQRSEPATDAPAGTRR